MMIVMSRKLIVITFVSILNTMRELQKLPGDLLLGAATSSHQVEGAWDVDGKTPNIWDTFTHTAPSMIADQSNADISCDSYHKIDEDIKMIKNLGLQFYRFSLSWTRILPTGFPNRINPLGLQYYNKLIDELLKIGVQPMVTIYHWELPQNLQELGGFANPQIAKWLSDYARVVFEQFGDRVKFWITINEAKQVCRFGYGVGRLAPGVNASGVADYLCTHNLLKAHAEIYHLYDKEFRPRQKGKIGVAIECRWSEPEGPEDQEAAIRRREFEFGLYMNPIFGPEGDYPEVVKKSVADRSRLEGFSRSRLPEFTKDEISRIKGTSDYFGLNHYTTQYVKDRPPHPIGTPHVEKDENVILSQDPRWPAGSLSVFRLVPWGVKKLLKHIKGAYDDPDIYITENGFPVAEDYDDQDRIKHIYEILQAVLESVYEDGVKVKGYTVWSLMDNFEWGSGFMTKFGLYHVNFTDPERTRRPKASADFYKKIIQTRQLPEFL